MGFLLRIALWALGVGVGLAITVAPARGEEAGSPPATEEAAAAEPVATTEPPVAAADSAVAAAPEPALALVGLTGRNIARIDVVHDPPLWAAPVKLVGVQVGQTFTPEVARRALDELSGSGRFGDLRAEAEAVEGGVLLRIRVVARRIIASLRVSGASDADDLLRAAQIRTGSEVTARELPELTRRLEGELGRRGYPDARVRAEALDTDDPMAIVLSFEVTQGPPARIEQRRFFVWPDPKADGLPALLASYGVGRGDRVNLDTIEAASRGLEEKLKRAGYHEARVEQGIERGGGGIRLDVKVYAGSRIRLRLLGNRRFESSEIEAALALEDATDRSPSALVQRVRDFYVERGFFDVSVESELYGRRDATVRTLLLRVHEGEPLRVLAREYPCLNPERSAADVGSEIDSFLSELPGGTLIDAVDPSAVDALFGPKHGAGRRSRPYALNPWSVYSPEVYERAVEHLEDLFRSEGYLSASVGPVALERRRCDVRSPPGTCIPLGQRKPPVFACSYDAIGLPTEEPPVDSAFNCSEDLARGVRCEPSVRLSIPIKLGPRSFIRAVRVDGNLALSDEELLRAAELTVAAPVSQSEIDRARRRLLDRYAEEGFAFADIEADLELSADHKQAVVVFVVSERKQVKVSRIVVRGARITSESLIRRRIALDVGAIYRRSLVRKTEERLATLGVFSTVSVGFEDPYVPASAKVVVVTVQEKIPQSFDGLFGFSTGEGFRGGFEYRHANLGGQAVRFTFHVQAGLLPLPLIFEDDVRKKYEELSVLERLERRNTVSLEFPDIGLGPLFRLSVEGVDVNDNARDYGLTKDAGILTLFFLPERRLSFQIAGSLERNEATIFGDEEKGSLDAYIRAHPNFRRVFRVPEGPTFVVAQRIGATWDRRDNPLDATRGSFISVDLEHATARPLGDKPTPDARPIVTSRGPVPQGFDGAQETGASVFEAVDSNFLRFTNRIAGYLRLSKKGLALAGSFRWGLNQQLTSNSRTYPDRLFFMGGVDSLRGFLQDALVPEDIAQKLLDPSAQLNIDQVVIRGGDVFINPRLELRIPLTDSIETALFFDAGNLWTDPNALKLADLARLRYATGTGIRVGTPIGPLVFDYGFNIERVLDAIEPDRPRQRYWEDIGAFHFSIGLF
jgi:outer membrane protein assembly factor BamA